MPLTLRKLNFFEMKLFRVHVSSSASSSCQISILDLKGKANSEAWNLFPSIICLLLVGISVFAATYEVFQYLLLLSIFQFIKADGSSLQLFTG